MQFTQQLLTELMKAKGFTKNNEMLEVIPKVSKGVLSELVNGKRHLTEEQALIIAKECNLNVQWVLVQLAEETAKSELAKKAWANLAKKISRSATAAALALMVIFSGLESKAGSDPVLA